jgi:hypothetical protein
MGSRRNASRGAVSLRVKTIETRIALLRGQAVADAFANWQRWAAEQGNRGQRRAVPHRPGADRRGMLADSLAHFGPIAAGYTNEPAADGTIAGFAAVALGVRNGVGVVALGLVPVGASGSTPREWGPNNWSRALLSARLPGPIRGCAPLCRSTVLQTPSCWPARWWPA